MGRKGIAEWNEIVYITGSNSLNAGILQVSENRFFRAQAG